MPRVMASYPRRCPLVNAFYPQGIAKILVARPLTHGSFRREYGGTNGTAPNSQLVGLETPLRWRGLY